VLLATVRQRDVLHLRGFGRDLQQRQRLLQRLVSLERQVRRRLMLYRA
jgi:hypothetical protein